MTDSGSTYWKVRNTLEEWVNRGAYGNVLLNDGTRLTFRPSSVTCRLGDDGREHWISVGLAWDARTGTDQYAFVHLAAVDRAEEIEIQPDQ